MAHSKIVGGSTAKRVINCPGSVALVNRMPPQQATLAATEGTALHACIEKLIKGDVVVPEDFLGQTVEGVEIEPRHVNKLRYAMGAIDQIDPKQEFFLRTEARVGFGDFLPGVFGSCDVVGRLNGTAYIIDWKFGDGVLVEAEDNEQLMFYAAAAMRTPDLKWVFEQSEEVVLMIVQPFQTRWWSTNIARIKRFEEQLKRAVDLSAMPDAPVATGDWCRWCTAKTICPAMNGAVDRLTQQRLEAMDPDQLALCLKQADVLETFIADARKLAQQRLEKNLAVPGYKLVQKRATRSWVDPSATLSALKGAGVAESDLMELRSPAQVEKVLKKHKIALPEGSTAAISSGTTLAAESDARPAAVLVGQQLAAALSKLQ